MATPPASALSTMKRKRPFDVPTAPASQPQDANTGQNIMTQVHFAVEYLRKKDKAMSFKDIITYLSIPVDQDRDSVAKTIRRILRTHKRVEYDKDGFNGQGSFRYRPVHPVRNADELKAYLQSRPTAQGIPVRELKEGWPDAIQAIDGMERKGELLVTRMKKDNVPKMVWQNDPTLSQPLDPHFKAMWHTIPLPTNPDELRMKLESAGLKPTSAPNANLLAPKPKEKKKKAPRRGGKQTNTHMLGILRDYSHKRK
ncbi:hypothetical protein BDY21DRAFT_335802 [Lineolata rhizophorae]|uniref:Transcription initiation factor IIE subunit beta n=1 Tax=Lineolata rhizophorae TaxID=578093 RepID=A0A6A6P9H0_9PEZI|nr:hypothetical protein BDY21DRAFT_335802 [Lineolata rhizophorae]